jgi:hypothetical protein
VAGNEEKRSVSEETTKPGTDHGFRALRIAGITLGISVAVYLAVLFPLSQPPEVVKDTSGCTLTNCGPLVFRDCNALLDGPLHVYTRLPLRYLEDCSYWRMGKPFCRAVVKVRNYCPA